MKQSHRTQVQQPQRWSTIPWHNAHKQKTDVYILFDKNTVNSFPLFVDDWYKLKISSVLAHASNKGEAEGSVVGQDQKAWHRTSTSSHHSKLRESESVGGHVSLASFSQAGTVDVLPGLGWGVGFGSKSAWSPMIKRLSLFPALSCNPIKRRTALMDWACLPSQAGLPCWHLSVCGSDGLFQKIWAWRKTQDLTTWWASFQECAAQ